MTESATVTSDGRRARRLRNRDAVVDALFDLLTEGSGVPEIGSIAERAGVSVSSVFRYFDGLDDLQRETIENYFIRYADLFEIPDIGDGSQLERIERFVDARLRLYETITPIARLARARAYDDPVFLESLVRARATFTDQIRRHFEVDLTPMTVDVAGDLVELVDAISSFEAWDLQHSTHGRDRIEIRRSWISALTRLVSP